MAVFNKDIIKLTTDNKHFQKEVYYDEQCQIVMMSIEPGDDIGEETHDADQTTFFVAGEGQVVVDGSRSKVTPNHIVVIPKGAVHNIINKGEEPLKLFTDSCAETVRGRRRLTDALTDSTLIRPPGASPAAVRR